MSSISLWFFFFLSLKDSFLDPCQESLCCLWRDPLVTPVMELLVLNLWTVYFLCIFKVRKGFWRPPPQVWLGDVSKIRVLDPYFLYQTAEKLLHMPLQIKGRPVSSDTPLQRIHFHTDWVFFFFKCTQYPHLTRMWVCCSFAFSSSLHVHVCAWVCVRAHGLPASTNPPFMRQIVAFASLRSRGQWFL